MLILGIETSCDETGGAVVADGRRVISDVLFSQTDIHSRFGGVVPELACRRHVDVIDHVVDEAFSKAGLDPEAIDAVAVTQGPGLVGALWIGIAFSKAFAYRYRKPLMAINHLEGHLAACELDGATIQYPAVGLVVSGGHSSLYELAGGGKIREVGRTIDDAAGEAFDKGAKMLGLGFPGGPEVDRLAATGDPRRFDFPRARTDNRMDFSFSGLKTSLRYTLDRLRRQGDAVDGCRADLAASYQAAIVDSVVARCVVALEKNGAKMLVASGGVAANSCLRRALAAVCAEREIALVIPSPVRCTDNGAMIAAAAYWHRDDIRESGFRLAPRPHWPLG